MNNLNQLILSKIESENLLEEQDKTKETLSLYLSTWKNLDSLGAKKHEIERLDG